MKQNILAFLSIFLFVAFLFPRSAHAASSCSIEVVRPVTTATSEIQQLVTVTFNQDINDADVAVAGFVPTLTMNVIFPARQTYTITPQGYNCNVTENAAARVYVCDILVPKSYFPESEGLVLFKVSDEKTAGRSGISVCEKGMNVPANYFSNHPALNEPSSVESDPTVLNDFDGVKKETLHALNPLRIGLGSNSDITETEQNQLFADLSTPGGILSRVIFFTFPLAGMILFVMIVWGGFEMLAGSATKKSMDAGRQRITAALIGFFLLFCSFWIVRIVETIFGVTIFF